MTALGTSCSQSTSGPPVKPRRDRYVDTMNARHALRSWLIIVTAIPALLAAAKHRGISHQLFVELEELSRIVDIAYCVGNPGLGIGKPFSCWGRCDEFPNFELVTTFSSGHLNGDSCGYIALAHEPSRRLIVSFRGSYSLANIIADLSTAPSAYVPWPGSPGAAECANCSIHSGFAQAWNVTSSLITSYIQELRMQYPGYQLVLVGHSLGGAVAGLAGLDFEARGWEPTITTFGEPRIGNIGFVSYLDSRFGLATNMTTETARYRRVTHAGDPVPVLPFEEWGYRSHAGEIHISKARLYPEPHDVWHCIGDRDPDCIADEDTSVLSSGYDSASRGQQLLPDMSTQKRAHLWELVSRHRDYFWRLGLCFPGSDPGNWVGHPYPSVRHGDCIIDCH